MNLRLFLTFVLCTCALLSKGVAHDLVLIPDDQGNLTIKLGHPGEYELPDVHKLYELTGYSSADSPGVSLLGKAKAAGAELKMIGLNELISGKPVMVGGQYDNGYWTTIAKDTYFNASKLLVPNAKEGSHNMKFGKGLGARGNSRGLPAQAWPSDRDYPSS